MASQKSKKTVIGIELRNKPKKEYFLIGWIEWWCDWFVPQRIKCFL